MGHVSEMEKAIHVGAQALIQELTATRVNVFLMCSNYDLIHVNVGSSKDY